MVAEHLAPLPPSLSAHGLPLEDCEGQEVLPPPDALSRRRRHDHPHEVVINPRQPQPVVIIDLVSDNEK
jgi:hypothetical protein